MLLAWFLFFCLYIFYLAFEKSLIYQITLNTGGNVPWDALSVCPSFWWVRGGQMLKIFIERQSNRFLPLPSISDNFFHSHIRNSLVCAWDYLFFLSSSTKYNKRKNHTFQYTYIGVKWMNDSQRTLLKVQFHAINPYP